MTTSDGDAAEARPGRLSRNIYVVSLVSFFQDTASEILYPVLPFFVTGVLGAPPAVLGLIEGLADGIASAMKAISGRLADLRHRRPLIAAGYGASAFGKFLLADRVRMADGAGGAGDRSGRQGNAGPTP